MTAVVRVRGKVREKITYLGLHLAKPLLVISNSRNIVRLTARSLIPAGWSITNVPFSEKAIDELLTNKYAMCILDADGPTELISATLDALFSSGNDTISLLLSQDTNSPFMRDLLQSQQLNNLIAKQGGMIAKQGISAAKERIDETELIVTCQKLYARDIFGLEKYISTWGVQIHDHTVTNTNDKRAALNSLQGYLDDLNCYKSIRQAVLWVADELLMNAMFNAPRDDQGRQKYKDHDRSWLQLEENESVDLKYCCDGRHIALSTTDHFGSLDRDVMLRYLNRCLGVPVALEERKAGAGLGLYIVFNSITQLAFNIEAGVATEVVALFYIRAGPRAFNESGKSLNIFLLQ